MLFVDSRFFLFLAIVLLVNWSLPRNEQRKWFLLFASYFFYGCWDWRFVGMLCVLSCGDYFFALKLSSAETVRSRRLYVVASLTMNLSVLAFFKYFHFFVGSAVAIAAAANVPISEPTIHIVLPVGVSFFTFQSLSYTLDVYRKEIQPTTSLRDYLCFAAFFPQLVAGPIVRPKFFLPQLASARTISAEEIKAALYLFIVGYLKKACIADNISFYVDQVFGAPDRYTAVASITATWLYTVQIFADFSGYSDMAIAVAALLGYKLVPNFDAPYLSSSIQEFWRRWHISLSSWIRDYIYISMGGRTSSLLRSYRNLMVTMLAGGLWHGAAWTFVAWGGMHGTALVVHQEFNRHLPLQRGQTAPLWRRFFGWFVTLHFVCVGWILFRAPNFSVAWLMIKRYFLVDAGGDETLPAWLLLLGPGLLLFQLAYRKFAIRERILSYEWPAFAFGYGCVWALTFAMLPFGHRPFIYFQF